MRFIILIATVMFSSSPAFANFDCVVGELLADPYFSTQDKFWKDLDGLSKANRLNEKTLENLKIKHSPNAARSVPKLAGMKEKQVEDILTKNNFSKHGKTAGGYDQWRHSDGSVIWIRPDGEIVRMSKEMKSEAGKSFRSRYSPDGELTESHNTGEKINRDN